MEREGQWMIFACLSLSLSQPNVIGQNQEPLLVFVNGKSGGNQGIKLLSGFRRHLNPHQVYDVMNGGPLPG